MCMSAIEGLHSSVHALAGSKENHRLSDSLEELLCTLTRIKAHLLWHFCFGRMSQHRNHYRQIHETPTKSPNCCTQSSKGGHRSLQTCYGREMSKVAYVLQRIFFEEEDHVHIEGLICEEISFLFFGRTWTFCDCCACELNKTATPPGHHFTKSTFQVVSS